ncbi:hypothetical protein J8B39_20725 [Vibrio parahaemolyticus]|nr:hypothetical protein [Vibrio parahaemolyticus]MBM5096008.1 hypothetical protein [Vibrio parahaemolyticus]MBM5418670.1 hypothetical protein [Vibrio parahaemolyticus]MCF9098319.1 hypothetical protein [Vibrio parahaemolyticus]MCF9116479.1 hypothetical protein [Vibrio parahaemolyticus]
MEKYNFDDMVCYVVGSLNNVENNNQSVYNSSDCYCDYDCDGDCLGDPDPDPPS